MSVFGSSHRLRRHDRNFRGTHQVLVYRLDNSDRVWWCDPLGPKDGYNGEWVTKWELAQFVNAASLGCFVGKIPVKSRLDKAIATVEKYVARLVAVKNKTTSQVKKLAEYRKRLADFIRRRNAGE